MNDQQKIQIAQDKASDLLIAMNEANIVTMEIVDSLNTVFHLNDLLALAQKNSFIALNYFQLICNIDYVLLMPYKVNPIGTINTGLTGTMDNLGGNTRGVDFEFTVKEKIAAVAYCFQIQAAKMNDAITTDTVSAFLQGTGAAQIAQDAVNAFLEGANLGKIIESVGKAAGAVTKG